MVVTTDGSAVPIINNGTLASSSGFLTIDNGGATSTANVSLQNNGLIFAFGGNISVDFDPSPFGTVATESLVNSGSVIIRDGGNLSLNGGISGNDLSLNGTGSLQLQQPNAFAGSTKITGFGLGDEVIVFGQVPHGPYAYTNGTLSIGTAAAIPFAGNYSLGNFEASVIGAAGSPEAFAYAPDGSPGGVLEPDTVAPTAESVATGSGTSHLTLGTTAMDQVNADLETLTYVPADGVKGDLITVEATPPAPLATIRELPIAIAGPASGPTLTGPMAETAAAGGTVAVSGYYSDALAQSNPGQLFLGISGSSGTLTATDAFDSPVTGSGSANIALNTDHVDMNAILTGLYSTAAGTGGTDTIRFDVWNQAGMETTGSTTVTPGAAAMSAADFLAAIPASLGTVATADPSGGGAAAPMGAVTIQPMPLVLGR